MKALSKSIAALTLLALPLSLCGQTENPRGIYKLTTLIGKNGPVNAPYDQYKLCTDSATIMFSQQNSMLYFNNMDPVYNYTGEGNLDSDDKSQRIYDSDSKHFTLKWWSEYTNHIYFPQNDWCTEEYEANVFSETVKPIWDLIANPQTDKHNKLIGTWVLTGTVNSPKGVKKAIKELHPGMDNVSYDRIRIFSPTHLVNITKRTANSSHAVNTTIRYAGKDAYMFGNNVVKVKWISKDCIIIEYTISTLTEYQIWMRATEKPAINYIVSSLMQ